MISERGLELIKHFEGCRLTAYQDSVGVWTIGVGSTRNVTAGMTITQQQADERLEEDCKDAERAVERFVKVPLAQHEKDALVSFTFNLGAGNLGKSTLLKLLNVGKRDEAANEFLRWDKAGGKVLPGLTRRRSAERAMFLGMNWR